MVAERLDAKPECKVEHKKHGLNERRRREMHTRGMGLMLNMADG